MKTWAPCWMLLCVLDGGCQDDTIPDCKIALTCVDGVMTPETRPVLDGGWYDGMMTPDLCCVEMVRDTVWLSDS